MSEKRDYRWENPAEIYVPTFMNNRELNPAYVESLEDSMRKDGFLPTFPITVFRRINLPYFDDFTSNLFVVACGVHRTTAAQNIGLAKVYVDLRTGTMDDFIEAMHTDNFKFDPTVDASIGQAFTKKEKREACKQLLLLPKYLKLTNTALAEMWHTSEGNIRRWRDEIASLIDEDPNSVDFCSSERLSEIKEILKSPTRETVAGDVVHIRQKSHDGKWDYYWKVQRKAENEGLDWNDAIIPYCQHCYEVDDTSLSEVLTMQQLSELDMLISEKDKDFLEQCRTYSEVAKKLKAARADCHNVYNECKKEFDNLMLLLESSYDDAYKKCFQSFGRAVSRNFGRNLLASPPSRDTVEKYESETELLKQLLKDIRTPAEYVHKFHDRYWKRRRKQREELEKELIAAHHLMLARVQEKFPGVDLFKFCLQVDSKSTYWLDLEDTPSSPMQRSDIDEKKRDKELGSILNHYKDMVSAIEENADWIVKLVSEEPASVELPDLAAQPVPDKEGLSAEFKQIFTLHNRVARDIVDCRALGETYHLHEDDVRDMMGDFQLQLGALEHAVRKVIKSTPDMSIEDISRRVEVDDIEVVQAMVAKIQLDETNRPSPPQSEPEIPEELPTLEPLSAWGAWRAQNYSGYFKIKRYLLDTYSREDGYKAEHQRLHASISLNCHVSAVDACLREIEFEKSCESQDCNWARVLSAFDVISTELDKVQWSDEETAKIEQITSGIQSVFKEHTSISRDTKLWVLANLAYEYMEELSASTNPGDRSGR